MTVRLHTIPRGNLMARRAVLRMFAVWPTHLPARDTIKYADLRTSTCDCRVALSLALEQPCDLDGFRLPDTFPGLGELVLFEVAA